MHTELQHDGEDGVDVEDVGKRSAFGESFQWFWAGFEQEAASEQQTLHGSLCVTEFNPFQVQDWLTVCKDEGV